MARKPSKKKSETNVLHNSMVCVKRLLSILTVQYLVTEARDVKHVDLIEVRRRRGAEVLAYTLMSKSKRVIEVASSSQVVVAPDPEEIAALVAGLRQDVTNICNKSSLLNKMLNVDQYRTRSFACIDDPEQESCSVFYFPHESQRPTELNNGDNLDGELTSEVDAAVDIPTGT
jgi:hypothetical protein